MYKEKAQASWKKINQNMSIIITKERKREERKQDKIRKIGY